MCYVNDTTSRPTSAFHQSLHSLVGDRLTFFSIRADWNANDSKTALLDIYFHLVDYESLAWLNASLSHYKP